METHPEAHWFGLERRTGPEAWERCTNPEWGKAAHWWEVGKVEPPDIAGRFGPGVYRVVWARKDRRRVLGESSPFKVGTPMPAPAPAVDRPAVERVAAPAAPPTAAQLSGLELDQGGNGVPVLLPTGKVMDKLKPKTRNLVTLFDLLDRQQERSKRADWAHWERMQSAEQARHHEALKDAQLRHERQLAETRQFYDEMQRAREHVQRQAVAGTGAASEQQLAALAAVAQQVQQLQTRLDEDDAEFDAEAAMAKLSANPNDLERWLTGAQRVFSTVLSSPLGEAFAQRLKESSGFVPPPMHDDDGGEAPA